MPRNTITEDFVLRCDREIYEHLDEYTNNKKNVFYGMYISEMKQLIRPTVDLWNGLWNQGEMACLFGETNVGKTTLALQIANDLAKRGLILKLRPYGFETVGVDSVNDLTKSKLGEYGETQTGWTADEAKGFIKVSSTPLRVYYGIHKDEHR